MLEREDHLDSEEVHRKVDGDDYEYGDVDNDLEDGARPFPDG